MVISRLEKVEGMSSLMKLAFAPRLSNDFPRAGPGGGLQEFACGVRQLEAAFGPERRTKLHRCHYSRHEANAPLDTRDSPGWRLISGQN